MKTSAIEVANRSSSEKFSGRDLPLDGEQFEMFPKREHTSVKCKPFLKWVGGKTQLLPVLTNRFPNQYIRYFEPFIGGGALLFNVQPQKAYISDANSQLIDCYQTVRDDVNALIENLSKHVYEKDYYYEMRNADRSERFKNWSKVEKSARLIYLNKTCFNGLYRVNSKGYFNVPIGRYKNPRILDEQNLVACSKALKNVQIEHADFKNIQQLVSSGDFVYFDPPYAPVSATADFTSYTKLGFDIAMQKELANLCKLLDKASVKFMLSNSNAPLILDLYKEFNISFVDASRMLNSRSDKRGKVKEVIVTNY